MMTRLIPLFITMLGNKGLGLSALHFSGQTVGRITVLTILYLLFPASYAAGLPAAATPGGALPQLEDIVTEPFVYPNTVPQELPQIERPDEIDAPRMLVKGFRIKGVQNHGSIDISQQSIEQLVVAKAQELVNGDAAKGFTLSMFEDITRAISLYYRQRGFFLARAYIPEQKIFDGIVIINIVEGFLDQIAYDGNDLYSNEQLDELFEPLKGESVFLDDFEQAIFQANDYPGLVTSALFGPGLKPGSAAVRVNIQERASDGFISFDNYGSIYTGEDRLRGSYQWNNLFGNADRLDVNAIMTFAPQNSMYFDVAYQQPLMDNRYMVGGFFGSNNFDVGGNLSDLGINGTSTIINGFMTRIITRDRTERLTTGVELSLKESESLVVSSVDSSDKLAVIDFSGAYYGTSWSGYGHYQQISVNLSLGLEDFLGSMDSNGDGITGRQGETGGNAGGGFTKLSFEYLRIIPLKEFQKLVFKLSGQTSSDLLTSLEQFSLGGPDTVRAYPVAEALMDTAWLFSAEWRANASPEIPQTWLYGLEFSVFYDWAQGSLNDPLPNDIDSVSLAGLGVGMDFRPFNKFRARIQYAISLGDEPSENQTLPIYFSLQYDF